METQGSLAAAESGESMGAGRSTGILPQDGRGTLERDGRVARQLLEGGFYAARVTAKYRCSSVHCLTSLSSG